MKNILFTISCMLIITISHATEKKLEGSGSTGRWVKIARIQNVNPINGSECSSISGTVNVQTDYGQTGSEQYYAIFSFGSRGGIKPLLVEYGDAANRSSSDISRIEWRIYTDSNGWHYLWFWQSNYSKYATFNYDNTCGTEFWTFEDPPADHTLIWSSKGGDRQYSSLTYANLHIQNNVAIGTTTTGSHKLAVEGSIGAREVKVETSGWSDYVFTDSYNLPTLYEIEQFIKKYGHLKNIPSEASIMKHGINLGLMNAKLLEKIEELTLHTIEQQKQIDSLKLIHNSYNELTKRLKTLEEDLNKMKKFPN